MFFRPRPKTQAIVIRWLVGLWLFAVVQSLAHACLLQQSPEPGHSAVASAHVDHHEDGVHHNPDADEALCLRACDESKSITWSVSLPWLADLGTPLPATFKPWIQRQDAAARGQVEGAVTPGDPPPTIRFLKMNR